MYNNIFKTQSFDEYLDMIEQAKAARSQAMRNGLTARLLRALAALIAKPVHA